MPLTNAQREAIQARGNVIVVAGAGTGKTSTLVERCVSLLSEECSIEKILMVTFTDAAAGEMRHRLRLRLAELEADSRGDSGRSRWWREQQALLETARISTLHSFCLQLIRENFHLLGIDPGVKILDERQVRPLIEGALDACLEPHFEGTDAVSGSVRDLIRQYGQGDPERIREWVLGLHRYGQSLESPRRWMGEQLALVEREDPGSWRDWLQDAVRQWAASWLPEMESAAGTASNLDRCARALQRLQAAGQPGQVSVAISEILAADAAEWPNKQKTRLRKPVEKLFVEAEFLAGQFEKAGSSDGLATDWATVRPAMRALLLLTREFTSTFDAAKREAGGIDFADLEQLTLRLLWDESGRATPVAHYWQTALDHVFVDECQDINAAQDAILRAISREAEGANRFLVGDVKQSIYQFRLARPALFLGYERQWGQAGAGRRVLLSDNFRCVPGIIGYVNAFFAPLMREQIGGVEYVPLKAGRTPECLPPAEAHERAVEFHLIPRTIQEGLNGEKDDGSPGSGGGISILDDLLVVEREARTVALRLRELHRSGLQIWDKEFKRLRRVEWRDMAVLIRSPAHRVEAFAQEFHRCGVPLQSARGGFLQSTEITDMLSLLRLLDNPLQDIPLLAALRSPLAALTLDELAEIRIASREKRFWTAVQEFHRKFAPLPEPKTGERGPGVSPTARSAWAKIDEFLERFKTWRELVRQTSLSQCLESALSATDYEEIIAATERGAERVGNVRRLIRMVREYDPYQRQGLYRFLRFVDALIEAGEDLDPAPVQSRNAVRLMSIHQSKGLEFPVVVVACLGSRFNLRDLSRDFLLDEKFGLSAKAVVPASGKRYPTLAHWLSARRQQGQILGEELRLLYVAFTRARDRLVLTATATRRDCDSWEAVGPREFRSREILSARSPLDWLLLWLPAVTATGEWQGNGGVNDLLRWKIWNEADARELPPPEPDEFPAVAPSELATSETAAVIRRIRWKYPHAEAAHEPAKTSVTALRRKAAEFMDEDAAQWRAAPMSVHTRKHAGPDLGAAEAGTVHHRFLQRIRLDGGCDEAGLQQQLAGMAGQGTFTAAEAAAIDVRMAARFWQGDVGREIRNRAENVRREVPFTARFSPLELARIAGSPAASGLAEEFVVVQGIVDLLVIETSELWLLDFKTDNVLKKDLQSKTGLYLPQLRLYASALASIYRRPVTRTWLCFLKAGETVAV